MQMMSNFADRFAGLHHPSPVARCSKLLTVVIVLATGCASPVAVLNLPPEQALPASEAALWNDISAIESQDWFYLLNAGDEALEWRLRMIDSARVSIDLETFLWKPDVSGLKIAAHILAAADRGVKVRFLLDDSFTMNEELPLHALDEHPNIGLRIYNPFQNRSDSGVWRQLFSLGEFARTNHRMHNKALVIDGRAALIGGRNLADEYFGLSPELNFRDMEVIAVGSSVPQVAAHFDRFWNSGWAFPLVDVFDEHPDAPGLEEYRIQLADSTAQFPAPSPADLDKYWREIAMEAYPGRAEFFFDLPATLDPAEPDESPDQLAGELLRIIDSAESEVILVSAYLVPTPELEEVVERIEARGVNVLILTNSLRSNNHVAAHAAYRGHVDRLVDHGAALHELRTTAADRDLYMQQPVDKKELGLHAKLLLIDNDVAFIGSCNLDPRSLKINTEVGLIIESEELNSALRKHLNIDFEPRNAWLVQRSEDGGLEWVGHDQVLKNQPSDSAIQRLEDWFIDLLPIDGEM
jgi:putative cardiolipin synthase